MTKAILEQYINVIGTNVNNTKFRGFDPKGNEWVYGDLIHSNGDIYIAPFPKPKGRNPKDITKVDKNSVGIYVYTTIDGIDIYTGDMITYGFFDNTPHTVMPNGLYDLKYGNVDTSIASFITDIEQYQDDKQSRLKVVSNVYDSLNSLERYEEKK